MTKTLTEQWREGTLPQGYYYIVANTKQKHKVIFYLPERNTKDEARLDLKDQFVLEVLAPVPSYEEWQSCEKCADMLIDVNKKLGKTIKKRKQLEKQLEIATKALEVLETKSDKFDSSCSLTEQLDFIKAKCQETLYQLKEMEGVK